MARRFNTAGPNQPEIHYTLPVLRRLPQVRRLVEERGYFVLHAPRQTGKTTTLQALAQELTAEGDYAALLVSTEAGVAFPDDPGRAERAMLTSWRVDAEVFLPPELRPPPWSMEGAEPCLKSALHAWAAACPKPLVVFIDEIDALRGPSLVSVLRQLRDGYRLRPRGFPHALALIGMRDVRDYRFTPDGAEGTHSASPFNIAVESMTLAGFTRDEVAALYAQHTQETGQVFEPAAVERAFELTQGQPWLVNALARQLTEVLVPDPSRPIRAEQVDRAREVLIQRQDTHLDSLAERLREPRVRAVIEPILAGLAPGDLLPDDLRYVLDLGLVVRAEDGAFAIANPIYREVVPAVLASTARAFLPTITPTWLRADGTLDTERLLDAFLAFWRQQGEALLGSVPYAEVAPHLVLMAFLQRVVNGGGTVEREYAIGRDRMDLCVRYKGTVLGIELKVHRPRKTDPCAAGLAQLDEYLASLGQTTGWLVIFDRRPNQPPLAERLSTETATTPGGRAITVVRA